MFDVVYESARPVVLGVNAVQLTVGSEETYQHVFSDFTRDVTNPEGPAITGVADFRVLGRRGCCWLAQHVHSRLDVPVVSCQGRLSLLVREAHARDEVDARCVQLPAGLLARRVEREHILERLHCLVIQVKRLLCLTHPKVALRHSWLQKDSTFGVLQGFVVVFQSTVAVGAVREVPVVVRVQRDGFGEELNGVLVAADAAELVTSPGEGSTPGGRITVGGPQSNHGDCNAWGYVSTGLVVGWFGRWCPVSLVLSHVLSFLHVDLPLR